MGELYIYYKVAGFCFITLVSEKILSHFGKNDLAQLSNIIGWIITASYAIKFTLDHAKNINIGW